MNWRKITGGLVWLLTGLAGMQAAGLYGNRFHCHDCLENAR